MKEPNIKKWNCHWLRDGVEYISKTEAMNEFKLTKEEFAAILTKADKENLQLRWKSLQNIRYRFSFTVYSIEDLKQILGLSPSQPIT